MNLHYRKHIFSKYFDHPGLPWEEGKKEAHRYNYNIRAKGILAITMDKFL